MKTLRISECDYIKANRRASRIEELESHSRPVRIGGIHKSRKSYDRKRDKAELKKALPYLINIAYFNLISCKHPTRQIS